MRQDEQEQLIKEMEKELDRLQALYNQYFMGIEKLEPTVPRKQLDRKIHLLRKQQIKNTALRFKFQSQIQKYNTHANHWKRICRQIEEGTYQRDLTRAKKRRKVIDEREVALRALSELDESTSPIYQMTDPGQNPNVHQINDEMGFSQTEMDDIFSSLDDPFSSPPDAIAPSMPPPIPAASKAPPIPAPSLTPPVPTTSKAPPIPAPSLTPPVPTTSKAPPIPAPSLTPPVPTTSKAPPIPSRALKVSAAPPIPTNQATSPPKKPVPQPSRAKAGQKPHTISEQRLKVLYNTYLAAKKRTHESTENLSYERVAAQLKKQIEKKPEIIDFKIAIKNGKTIIRTVKK